MAKTPARSVHMEQQMLTYVRGVVNAMMQQVQLAKLTKPGSEIKILANINNILDQFGFAVADVIPKHLLVDYFGGVDAASQELFDAGIIEGFGPGTGAAASGAGMALTKQGLISKPFQKIIHMKALELLIDDTMDDMSAAIRTAKGSAEKVLNNVRRDLAQAQISGATWKGTQADVMKSFREQGMTSFITSDGKELPLDFYSMTVVRTKQRAAAVQGSANRFIDAGQEFVEIVGNGDSCAKCSAHIGVIMSLTGATPDWPAAGSGGHQLPPFHPNCRCGVRLFNMKRRSAEEIEAARRRNAAFDPEQDRRTPAQKAAYANEQKLRRIANSEKKTFMRMQEVLGAEAPKNLAAFRRMKRQDTDQFASLQTQMRSNIMRDSWARRQAGLPTVTQLDQERKAANKAAAAASADPVKRSLLASASRVQAAKVKRAANMTNEPATLPAINPADYQLPDPSLMVSHGDSNYNLMTDDEEQAYHGYVATGVSFEKNRLLYSGEYDEYRRGDRPMNDRIEARLDSIDEFSKLIRKHQLPQAMKTVRMVDNDFLSSVMQGVGVQQPVEFDALLGGNEELLKTLKGSLTGVRYKNKSFTSVSYDPDANAFTRRPIKMELLSDAGQTGLITKNHDESEIVFDKDTEFEFVDFRIEKGRRLETLNIIARIVP